MGSYQCHGVGRCFGSGDHLHYSHPVDFRPRSDEEIQRFSEDLGGILTVVSGDAELLTLATKLRDEMRAVAYHPAIVRLQHYHSSSASNIASGLRSSTQHT